MFSIFAHVMKTLGDTNNPRVNCLKTIPFTAGYTYIAHIWQYPPPPPGSPLYRSEPGRSFAPSQTGRPNHIFVLTEALSGRIFVGSQKLSSQFEHSFSKFKFRGVK